jgi:hypothetical protein
MVVHLQPCRRFPIVTQLANVSVSDRPFRVYQENGGSDLVGCVHGVRIRPSKVIANAFKAGFHRVAHRARPLPVGSRERVVR